MFTNSKTGRVTGADWDMEGIVGDEPRKVLGQIVESLLRHCKELGFYFK